MTETLFVEPDTKADAVRRQLARMGSGPVAVILPDGWNELDSTARLRLIQRQAQAKGQELALVTQDLSTRRIAGQLGIPVYSSEAAFRGRRWQMHAPIPRIDPRDPAASLPEPPPWRKRSRTNESADVKAAARPSLHRSRQRRIRAMRNVQRPTPLWLQILGYALVGLFLAVILGGFAYYVLPAATVTLVPGQQVIETTVPLTADPQLEVADLEQGLLPARLMETYVEGTGRIATSGSEQSAVEPAVGTVVFTNQTNRTVRIPAGTIVSTSTGDRIDFRTRNQIEIPGPTGTQASVAVEATEPGTQGNVRANTITTVPGALRSQVRVTNPGATGGGASALVRVVKQIDKDTLLDQVYADLRNRAYDELRPELREGEWMPPESIQTFIVAQFFDHFNDEPADELGLTLRVLVQGVGVSQDASQEAAMAALRRAVPERGQLVADSIEFFVEPNTVVNGRTVRYAVSARGNYVIPIDPEAVSRAVAGLTAEEAAQQLQQEWLLAEAPEFYRDPAWFDTLPQIPSRIQVRVELDEAARASR